jgi:hypothetical protein
LLAYEISTLALGAFEAMENLLMSAFDKDPSIIDILNRMIRLKRVILGSSYK